MSEEGPANEPLVLTYSRWPDLPLVLGPAMGLASGLLLVAANNDNGLPRGWLLAFVSLMALVTVNMAFLVARPRRLVLSPAGWARYTGAPWIKPRFLSWDDVGPFPVGTPFLLTAIARTNRFDRSKARSLPPDSPEAWKEVAVNVSGVRDHSPEDVVDLLNSYCYAFGPEAVRHA